MMKLVLDQPKKRYVYEREDLQITFLILYRRQTGEKVWWGSFAFHCRLYAKKEGEKKKEKK